MKIERTQIGKFQWVAVIPANGRFPTRFVYASTKEELELRIDQRFGKSWRRKKPIDNS